MNSSIRKRAAGGFNIKPKKQVNFKPDKTAEELEQERIMFLRFGITKSNEEVKKEEVLIHKWKPTINIH